MLDCDRVAWQRSHAEKAGGVAEAASSMPMGRPGKVLNMKRPPSLVRFPLSASEFRSARRQKYLTLEYFELNEKWFGTLAANSAKTIRRLRGEGDLEPFGQRCAFQNGLDQLLMHYTAGFPIDALEEEFKGVMNWFDLWHLGFSEYLADRQVKTGRELRLDSSPLEMDESLEDFQAGLTVASLAVLLGDAPASAGVARRFHEYLDQDMLMSGVLEPILPQPSTVEKFFHRVPYAPLLDAMFTANTDEEAVAFVEQYLNGWYQGFAGTCWHDGHLVKKEHMMPYYGYWAFEAAAVCLLFNIDDSRFRNHIVYPKDIADWARKNDSIGKLKAAAKQGVETTRLRCMATQPCPRTGFWFTPARAESRRHFNQGEPMPDVGGDYGVTIWQWDAQQ